MNSDLESYLPPPAKTGLNTVRAIAKNQSCFRLKKTEGELGPTSSCQNLKSLKTISAQADAEREIELAKEPCWVAKLWGMFQTAIGNR